MASPVQSPEASSESSPVMANLNHRYYMETFDGLFDGGFNLKLSRVSEEVCLAAQFQTEAEWLELKEALETLTESTYVTMNCRAVKGKKLSFRKVYQSQKAAGRCKKVRRNVARQ